jgi:hypothetical protein
MTNVDFGAQWRLPNGQGALLCWHRISGELILHRPDGHTNDVLAVNTDEDDVRARLEDWASHCDLPGGLGWVATQMEGYR